MRILAQTDFDLINVIVKVIPFSESTKELRHFSDELKKAKIIKDNKIGDDIVRINSIVAVEDITKGTLMQFQIVLPEDANMKNFKEMKVSILAPLSIALLGFKKDFIVDWHMPAGPRKLKITKVENLTQVIS